MPQWYYTISGQQHGPVERERLAGLLASGQLGPSESVWTEGMANWMPPGQVPELASHLAAAGPPAYVYPPAQMLGYQPAPGQYLSYSTPAPASRYASLATASMVLGLCSFLVGTVLTGLAALICGWIALRGMKRTGNYQNKGYAITGLVIGLFWAVATVAIIVILILVISNGQ